MRLLSIATKDNPAVELDKLTVLVGPNNVGKSQTLRDIYTKMVSGKAARTVLVSGLTLKRPTSEDELLLGLTKRPHPTNCPAILQAHGQAKMAAPSSIECVAPPR